MVAKTGIRHSTAGDGTPVILLHGLFGAGNNLGALARSLSDRYRVYSLDLPNHGRSAWVDEASLHNMASAIFSWMDEQGLGSAAIAGHSLGGKVAMQMALSVASRVDALVVADIAPVEYPPHHDAVFTALDAVAEARCESREMAADIMSRSPLEEGVIHFLLMSLKRSDDGIYRWRFNLEGIKRDYRAVRARPDAGQAYAGPVLFVKGGDSDYILPEHQSRVLSLFPSAQLKVMSGCGHWLHAQQPALFNSIVGRFLDQHARAESSGT